MRRARSTLLLWVALWWLWLLLVGEWDRYEWIAAAVAATIGTALGVVALRLGGVRARIPLEWVRRARTVPVMVLVDFGILVWALVRSLRERRVVRGVYRANAFPARGTDPSSRGIRAWVELVANYTPNAILVDVSREQGTALVHDLIPNRASEKPA